MTSSEISKGTVLHWESYEFLESGEKKDSLFLVLTDCQDGGYLAIRATTKTEFYEKPTSSINREFMLLKSKEEKAFARKTVFDFAKIRVLHLEQIKKGWNQSVSKTHPISEEFLFELDKKLNSSKVVAKNSLDWIRKSEPVAKAKVIVNDSPIVDIDKGTGEPPH